jgi:Family of unknown function (DUF5681)
MSDFPVPKQYPHRFRPGISGNPKGKPRGPNYATRFMESLKKGDSKAIIAAMVEKARNGSVAASELILSRLMPVPVGRRVNFAWPSDLDSVGVGKAFDSVLIAIGEGRLTIEEGLALGALLEKRAKVIDTGEIQSEIAELREMIERLQASK